MPIYEYRCEECGRTMEALQRLNEPPLSECSHCGGPLRKLISAPAFQFKGSGWYATDYANKGSGKGSRGGDGESGGGGEAGKGGEAGPGKETSDSGSTAQGSGGDKKATPPPGNKAS